MRNIKHARIENTILVTWDGITTNDERVPLTGRDLSLVVETPNHRRVSVDFIVDDEDECTIHFLVQGTINTEVGVYNAVLYENHDTIGMQSVSAETIYTLYHTTAEAERNQKLEERRQ